MPKAEPMTPRQQLPSPPTGAIDSLNSGVARPTEILAFSTIASVLVCVFFGSNRLRELKNNPTYSRKQQQQDDRRSTMGHCYECARRQRHDNERVRHKKAKKNIRGAFAVWRRYAPNNTGFPLCATTAKRRVRHLRTQIKLVRKESHTVSKRG